MDGDQRMWLRVAPGDSVVVLDYGGAPYLRFSASGVEVNRNSAMYYLNQTPFAQTPPSNLDRSTPPRWQGVTGAHDYGWHDGRLHALATVALPPGVAYVGRWSIPLLINGRPSALLGGLWHAGDPSIVWFWPIAVVLLCVLAAWRVRRPALDLLVARVLAITALIATAAAALARDLHGRPSVSVFQLIELAVLLAFVAWGLGRVLLRRPGLLLCFVIAFVAVWEAAPPAETARLARFFGFSYQKVPEDNRNARDWWTGKPLTYDVDHSDNYFVIDPAGIERVVQDAAP